MGIGDMSQAQRAAVDCTLPGWRASPAISRLVLVPIRLIEHRLTTTRHAAARQL